ncbi:MAG: hypothetical protein RLZZ210_1563 [Pseudomonadota bacterium]
MRLSNQITIQNMFEIIYPSSNYDTSNDFSIKIKNAGLNNYTIKIDTVDLHEDEKLAFILENAKKNDINTEVIYNMY